MSERKRERLLDGLSLPESPRWHEGRLWLSDMGDGRVIALSLDGTAETVVTVPGNPSGLGWLPDGTLLVVSMEKQCIFAIRDSALAPYADLGGQVAGDANDMVVDGQGRAYVGNVGFDHRLAAPEPRTTHLVLVEPDRSVRSVGGEVLVPNGTVITPDGETLIVAETALSKLTAFHIADDGSLEDGRTFAELPGTAPDGIGLDAEGCVWVANAAGTSFIRVREGGQVADEIDVGRCCLACILGGPDGTTLFMMTSDGFDPPTVAKATGAVETVKVGTPAAGWP